MSKHWRRHPRIPWGSGRRYLGIRDARCRNRCCRMSLW